MRKIILDTNFLMAVFQFKIDIFSEFERVCNFNYELCIFDQSIYELNNIIKNQRGRHKRAAKMALEIIKRKKVNIIKSRPNDVDLLILENADENTIVATQDKTLKKKLLEKGISVIILRQRKYLKLIEMKESFINKTSLL